MFVLKMVSKPSPEELSAGDVGGSRSPGPEVAVVDVAKLASILMQAKGPIIDRLQRSVAKFNGDGTQDVSLGLTSLSAGVR